MYFTRRPAFQNVKCILILKIVRYIGVWNIFLLYWLSTRIITNFLVLSTKYDQSSNSKHLPHITDKMYRKLMFSVTFHWYIIKNFIVESICTSFYELFYLNLCRWLIFRNLLIWKFFLIYIYWKLVVISFTGDKCCLKL